MYIYIYISYRILSITAKTIFVYIYIYICIYDPSTRPQTMFWLAIIQMIISDGGGINEESLSLYRSISLSLYLSIYLSIYLSLYLSLFLSLPLSLYRSPSLSLARSLSLSLAYAAPCGCRWQPRRPHGVQPTLLEEEEEAPLVPTRAVPARWHAGALIFSTLYPL